MGGQWRSGGCLLGQATRTGSGSKESAEHQRDGHQAPTQAQTPQHHHFQVSRNWITVQVLKLNLIHSCGEELRNADFRVMPWTPFRLNVRPSALFQRYLHAGSVLLHHHGVLCTGAAVWGAESRQEDPTVPAHGLGHGHRWRNELSAPPQDHPQRSEVPKVSEMTRTFTILILGWY